MRSLKLVFAVILAACGLAVAAQQTPPLGPPAPTQAAESAAPVAARAPQPAAAGPQIGEATHRARVKAVAASLD